VDRADHKTGADEQLPRLVEKIREGDREAFMTVAGLFQQRIFVLAFSIVRNREDALDVVQETFLRMFRKIHMFRPGCNFQNWLLRIARNLAIDAYRKNRGKTKGLEADRSVEEFDPAGDDGDCVQRAADMRREFSRCIGRLANRQKTVFIMKHYEECPYHEISEAMNISIGTVKSLHHKAVRNLRKWLAPHLGMQT
jgi:RNA polymerase sigma-70 factor, ECF subfamily